MHCPLCNHTAQTPIAGPDEREYWRCAHCALIHVPTQWHLTQDESRARYATHKNTRDNPGYVEFLSQILDPMRPYLHEDQRVLDYGCGPGPVLAELIREVGPRCDIYDPCFFPETPQPPYDAIFSTECVEHFTAPRADFETMLGLLQPEGYLALMTLLWNESEDFSQWFYPRDPTHLAFFHSQTFAYLCEHYGLRLLKTDGKRCLVLQKLA